MTFTDFVTPVPADWLNNVNTVVNNVQGQPYLRTGTGTVSRTIQSKLNDMVSVVDFGADPTGNTDSTSAMQAAHNSGFVIYYPPGTYHFTSISFASGGIIGAGPGNTTLVCTDAGSLDAITYTGFLIGNATPGIPVFRDFTLSCSNGSKTVGSGINCTPSNPAQQLGFARFDNLVFQGCPTGLKLTATPEFKITGCDFLNFIDTGLSVSNTVNGDSGDSVISDSFFFTGAVTGNRIGITHLSSGGLKILGCKLNGMTTGYAMQYNSNAQTGVLVIVGNSIENCTNACISLARTSGTGSYGDIIISGNEMANSANGIEVDTSGSTTGLVISNNFIGVNATNGISISLGSVNLFNVTGNILEGNGSGGQHGLDIGAACQNGHVSSNSIFLHTIPINYNPAATAVDFVRNRQQATVNVSTTTAYGSLFIGSTTITFPRPFFQIGVFNPEIWATPISTSTGAISCLITNGSVTGFTLSVIGTTNTTSIPIQWFADGVL